MITRGGGEKWKKVKKVGSLLGDADDFLRRKSLAITAMREMKSIWIRNRKTHIQKRLQLYNSLVKPILTYNSCTWGLTKQQTSSLDSFHRQQLRQVWNISYPDTIRNHRLYERSGAHPISKEIKYARWRFFGHALRLEADTPAQKAMDFYFENISNPKYRGRPRTTIVTTLNEDIKAAKHIHSDLEINEIHNARDLETACSLASQSKESWRTLAKKISSVEL